MRRQPARTLIVLALIAATATTAGAQSALAPLPTTVQLEFAEPEMPATTTRAPLSASGTVTYCYTAPGTLTSGPTYVTLDVAEPTGWALVTVTPAGFDVPLTRLPTGTRVCAEPVHVRVLVTPLPSERGHGSLTVNVTAHENVPHAESASSNTLFIGSRGITPRDVTQDTYSTRAPAFVDGGRGEAGPLLLLVAGLGLVTASAVVWRRTR